MPELLDQLSLIYQPDFTALQARSAPHWLRDLRDRAMLRFTELDFPTTRDEEWRYTNIKPIATTPFILAEPAPVSPSDLAAFTIENAAALLVFVDGRYHPWLSHVSHLPAGVTATNLVDAICRSADLVHTHLARYADFQDDAFNALNTAFIEDGAFVHVPGGVTFDAPIHLLFVSTDSDTPRAAHPRNLILAGRDSAATVVEHYATLTDGVYFSNAVTEAVAGSNARLSHYLLDEESDQAYNVSTLRVHQERGSNFESHSALLGGAIVRNNVHVELQGEHCQSLVNGLFVGRGSQHLDNHMRVVHAQPHGDSRQFYKGILAERAHGVFTGRIFVAPGAQKTDAKQTNRNLLLSDDAQVDTRPQLEIYADDVKCTHGATTGRLDEEALFYFQSRGLDEHAARAMLIHAFAHESLERMGLATVRERLGQLLHERLPHAEEGG